MTSNATEGHGHCRLRRQEGKHGADVVFDISEYIGTGEPNPNLGRPVIIDESFGTHDEFSTDREAFRATAFYSIDFKEKTDNLGGWAGMFSRDFTAT